MNWLTVDDAMTVLAGPLTSHRANGKSSGGDPELCLIEDLETKTKASVRELDVTFQLRHITSLLAAQSVQQGDADFRVAITEESKLSTVLLSLVYGDQTPKTDESDHKALVLECKSCHNTIKPFPTTYFAVYCNVSGGDTVDFYAFPVEYHPEMFETLPAYPFSLLLSNNNRHHHEDLASEEKAILKSFIANIPDVPKTENDSKKWQQHDAKPRPKLVPTRRKKDDLDTLLRNMDNDPGPSTTGHKRTMSPKPKEQPAKKVKSLEVAPPLKRSLTTIEGNRTTAAARPPPPPTIRRAASSMTDLDSYEAENKSTLKSMTWEKLQKRNYDRRSQQTKLLYQQVYVSLQYVFRRTIQDEKLNEDTIDRIIDEHIDFYERVSKLL